MDSGEDLILGRRGPIVGRLLKQDAQVIFAALAVKNHAQSDPLPSSSYLLPSVSLSSFNSVHDLVVHDKDNCGSSASENISKRALEEALGSLIGKDLAKAVTHTVVHLFSLRLGGLILESSLESVKRVSGQSTQGNSNLGHHELTEDSE